VDEIIEGVSSGIVKQVFVKDGLVGFFAAGTFPHNGQAVFPNQEFLFVQVSDDALSRVGVDGILLPFFTIGAVLKTND